MQSVTYLTFFIGQLSVKCSYTFLCIMQMLVDSCKNQIIIPADDAVVIKQT